MKKYRICNQMIFFLMLTASVFAFSEFASAATKRIHGGISIIAKVKKDKDADTKKKEKKPKEEPADKKVKDALRKYKEGQKEAQKKKWNRAIKKYNEALNKLKEPTDGYYPYLGLGLAYLYSGDLEQARTNCRKSRQYGKAQAAEINECLTMIEHAFAQVQPAQPAQAAQSAQPAQPTQPTQPAQASQASQVSEPAQPQQTDAAPKIVIAPDIPAETELATITIRGKAMDDTGVSEVTITRTQADTRAIVESERAQMTTIEEFTVDVQLEQGPNEFVIEAVDMAGQKATQVITVMRISPQPSGARGQGVAEEVTKEEGAPQERELYAVIIGIGDYQDEKIPDLRFTVNDAMGMYEVLTDPQFGGVPEENIQLLLNEDATVSNIKKAIGVWLKRMAREEDTVIIYYAGHGAPEDNETYWVTYDADIESLYASALSNNEIADMLNRIESKRILTFLDSCYSAATVNRSSGTRDIFLEAPLEKFTGEGQVVISASDGQQLSLEMEAYEHGVFTYYLLEALKGQADGLTAEERDGIIEIEEVWNYVRNQVTETARKQGNDQTPKFQGGLTAGIPLTYDREFLEEQARQRQQEIEEKQAKLQELFEQGQFEDPADFECAYTMVESGEPDKYIDGLVNGKLSMDMFNKLFECKQ